MHSLILIALFLSCGGNGEVIRKSQSVQFAMGGSQVIFNINGIEIEDNVLLKCIVRFSDGRDSIAVEATLVLGAQSVFCRLPPEINSGSVTVDVEAASTGRRNVENASTGKRDVLLSKVVFINSSPSTEVVVEETWDTNELSLTWDSEYFQQFFNPGTIIWIEVTVYAAESMEPVFAATEFTQIVGANSGTSTVAVTNANVDNISNIQYPYFYVLRPVGAPNYYMSSFLFAPTLGMTDSEAARKCGIWLENEEGLTTTDEINPCPPCLCQVKLDDNFIQTHYDPQHVKLANGALDNHVLYYERVPANGGHAQTCSYNTLTKNLATTFPEGSWVHAFSKYVSYQKNFFGDIWPYIVCCLQSNNTEQLCDMFHEKRPIDTGHKYEGPENPSCGCGDPHFVTFNGAKYDFMGNGEFWLIRGPTKGGFGVQGRMSPILDHQKVSYFTAVAMKDGNTTVQLGLKNKSFYLLINGVEFPIPAHPTTLPLQNAHIIIDGNLVNVRLQTGFSVIVENLKNNFLNVYSSGAHRNKGKGFMGIFGNFANDIQNDLTSQTGFVIPLTSKNLLDLKLLHHRFGMTWMTTANESLFVYEDGKSWEDYAHPDFGPILEYPDPATMPEEVRTICGDSLFCYYEYMGTGSLERAADVAIIEQEIDELREEIRTVERPMCDVVRSPGNGRVRVNGYFNGSIATYSCDREYDFISGDRTRTCSASELESYWTGVEPVCIWTCTTCEQNTEYQLSHNPADCTKFFLCSMGQRLLLECPLNRAFNPATLVCAEDYVCRDTPGC